MRILTAAFAALLLLSGGGPATAREAPDLAVYGRLPAVELIEISPDGTRLASVSGRVGMRRLKIFNVEDLSLIRELEVGDIKVRGLEWVDTNRLLVTASETVSMYDFGGRGDREFTQARILDISTGRFATVFNGMTGLFPAVFGQIQVRETGGETNIYALGVYIVREAVDLFRISPANGRGVSAEAGDYDIERYAIDARGQAVGRYLYSERTRRWSLEAKTDGRWREIRGGAADLDAPWLVGLGRDGRSLLLSGTTEDVEGAVEIGPDGGEHPLELEGDGEAFILHPRTGALLGVQLEGGRTQMMDPAARRMWGSIERAFNGRRPRVVSFSANMRRAVVYNRGQDDTGLYHIVDLDAGRADVLGIAYPDLDASQIGAVSSLTYEAGDGLEIQAWLTLPPGVTEPSGLPLVVLPHGGPASRDDGGFEWWAQAIASRGYAVLQPNFRGSTGRGTAFMEAGYGQWGRRMQTDLSDGVRKLAADGIIDPARVCIVGASYGGYAALAGVTVEQGVYRCAVSVAGPADLRSMVIWERRRGETSNSETVRYWNRFMGASRLDDPALDPISPARLAERADAPVLLIHGRDDTVVPVQQSRAMANALRAARKPHELIELEGEDHWLSMAETRGRMLRETVRFLLANNPPD